MQTTKELCSNIMKISAHDIPFRVKPGTGNIRSAKIAKIMERTPKCLSTWIIDGQTAEKQLPQLKGVKNESDLLQTQKHKILATSKRIDLCTVVCITNYAEPLVAETGN
ncbi:hypothetical protein GDO81_005623 [Engystomops pustulosus]|uniref:Uncharacterized protein n=1 Tax=Engystomops pustulosus TaxID=76066 RepID=A0AAV7CR80_ENGPU|nr:hypothetical protein GDO81_005623 [Engystomops pustulosus]